MVTFDDIRNPVEPTYRDDFFISYTKHANRFYLRSVAFCCGLMASQLDKGLSIQAFCDTVSRFLILHNFTPVATCGFCSAEVILEVKENNQDDFYLYRFNLHTMKKTQRCSQCGGMGIKNYNIDVVCPNCQGERVIPYLNNQQF